MKDRFIHPTAIIHPSVRLGVGCHIGRGVWIEAGAIIGNYACIGGMPEHRDFLSDFGCINSKGVRIGVNAKIFEFVTIHAGTRAMTLVGDEVVVQNHSHVGHDCVLQRGAMIGGQVSLAGHTIVMEKAIVAGKSCTHQFSVVGAYSILSAMSYLKGHVPPGEKWIGNPARAAGLNDVGLERAGFTHAQILARHTDDFVSITKERKI